MNKVIPILLFAMAMFWASCAKDDFNEIVGLCPLIVSTDPANSATNVPLDQVITATFNGPMNPATINVSSFILQGTSVVPGTVSYAGVVASFTPTLNLEPFTTYTATITTTTQEITGNALQANYVWSFTTGAPGVNLGSADRFGILAGTGINSTGLSEIQNLDIGVSPGLRSSITGFPPGEVVNGVIYASNDLIPIGIPEMLFQAHQDLTAAYHFAENAAVSTTHILSGDLGGLTLTPGIYKSLSTLAIQSGDLTLDAQNDPNAFWIFQMDDDFTTIGGAGGNVILVRGAKAQNIYWQSADNATIGAGTSFQGTLLVLNTIRMNSGATIAGRLLSSNGTVVLSNSNIIIKP